MECVRVDMYIWLDELGFMMRRNDVVTVEILLGMQCLVRFASMEQWVKYVTVRLSSNMIA